jgi:hypothetical protein
MVDDKCMIDDEWTIILSQVNRINQPEMRIRLDLFGIVTPCESLFQGRGSEIVVFHHSSAVKTWSIFPIKGMFLPEQLILNHSLVIAWQLG